MDVRGVKGMNDVLPSTPDVFLRSGLWQRILEVTAEVFGGAGFQRVWLPLVEETVLFARGIGEGTDIVAKEMYSFEDRGGRALALRPEGTAGAVRAYVEHRAALDDLVQRWWYFGPMFRAERPQKGRYRQFYQIGAEVFAMRTPESDAELIVLLWTWMQRLGVKDVSVRVNSLGDDATRAAYREALQHYLMGVVDDLAKDKAERADIVAKIEQNPLRFLDSKRPDWQAVLAEAPDISASWALTSRAHIERVMAYLDRYGVKYKRDGRLVRGLDYYTDTIFEFTSGALGSQDAVLGGGRYNHLVAQMGGLDTPAVGFAAGVERLALLANLGETYSGPQLAFLPMTGAEGLAMDLAMALRPKGWRVEVDTSGARLKAQLRRADRCGVRHVVVVGDQEVSSLRGKIKDLRAEGDSAEREVELTAAGIDALLRQLYA